MTRVIRIGRSALAAAAVAGMVACGNGNPNPNNAQNNPKAAPPAPAASQTAANQNHNTTPMTVTGCLQQGKSGTYILTRLNEPSQKSVGTSGTAGQVEREQVREAENAYRIDAPKDVKMDDMVGKKVRVSGDLTDRGDVAKEAAETTGTSGNADKNNKDKKGADIGTHDLAKIQASSVTLVSDACGAASNKAASGAKTKKRGRR